MKKIILDEFGNELRDNNGQVQFEEVKHTPTPWEVNGLEIQATNREETFIAEVFNENESAKANAQFIVKAVNCHDELIEALAHLIACADCKAPELPEALENARKTLKKAGESCA